MQSRALGVQNSLHGDQRLQQCFPGQHVLLVPCRQHWHPSAPPATLIKTSHTMLGGRQQHLQRYPLQLATPGMLVSRLGILISCLAA